VNDSHPKTNRKDSCPGDGWPGQGKGSLRGSAAYCSPDSAAVPELPASGAHIGTVQRVGNCPPRFALRPHIAHKGKNGQGRGVGPVHVRCNAPRFFQPGISKHSATSPRLSNPGTHRCWPESGACPRSKRRSPSQALAQRDQDHPSAAQNCRHPCCRDSRPHWSRPVYPIPRRPQPCGLKPPPIYRRSAQSAPTSGCAVNRAQTVP